MAGDSHNGSAIHRQGEKDIELTGAIDEVLGAIERIGDPTAPDREAGGIVGALLGEEGIAWNAWPMRSRMIRSEARSASVTGESSPLARIAAEPDS